MRRQWYGPGGAAVVVCVAVSACGSLPERRDAGEAEVTRFEQALDAGQHGLCAALAPAARQVLADLRRAAARGPGASPAAVGDHPGALVERRGRPSGG
jgi:hypothetical protein